MFLFAAGGKPGDITVVLGLVAFDLVATSSTLTTSAAAVSEHQQRLNASMEPVEQFSRT